MEGLTIREATEMDYDDIIAIRENVHGGRDYLQDSFEDIIKRNKGYVAILDQQIIGFMFACIIDNGMTLLTRSSRVREKFEGMGVIRKLNQHIMEIYENSVKYKAVSYNDNNVNLKKKVQDGSLKVTLSKKLLGYTMKLTELRQNYTGLKATSSAAVKRLTPDDVADIFSSENLCNNLFPSKMLASNWVPLRIMKENIAHVFAESGVVLGSNITHGEDHSRALLTIGHAYTCPLGHVLRIDIYGSDLDHIMDHIVLFRNDTANVTKEEDILFEVYTDPETESAIDSVMAKLGFRRQNWTFYSTMYCAEFD